MDFKPYVLMLFGNALLTTVICCVVVGVILLREYRPTIARLKRERDAHKRG
ncbi:hypothetical protein [Salinisphaera sp.]|uniref:hypothetical protein n=1 Tax=Salinisphaera sp. TaxID=1914330 RepID=UPI0025D87CB5|nr:hypothetical protein [Salinisphaera sp.]|tara:strand:+ start:361 stop:513 length:153 start_codon:yes stop_codon:yes gene_type:complete